MQILKNYVLRYKKVLTFALLLAAINQIFSLLDPQIFRVIIDTYASHVHDMPGSEFLKGVTFLLLLSVGTAFISRTAKAFQDYYVNVTVQKVGTGMYAEGVEHSFSLPYAVFEDQRSGELLGKLQKARADSQDLITNAINILFFSAVGILFVIIYATYVYWLIGFVYFLIIPILGIIVYILSKKIKEIQRSIVLETTALAGSTTETLRNVELVKSLGLEEQEIRRLNATNERILGLELKKVKLVRKLDFVQGTTVNALRSSLLLLMLWFIFKGTISLGEFFSLWFYSFAIFVPLGQLGTVASLYQQSKASMGELQKVLALQPDPVPDNLLKVGKIQSIQFQNVNFQYPTAEKQTLKDLSFEIKAGETVAFVGPSGSGKSTVIKLISGLYKPNDGTIQVNNTDIHSIDLNDLRRSIGLVSQETQLFAGTIRENLLFVSPKASDEDALGVLKQSEALGILDRTREKKESSPNSINGNGGLDTKIGEGGVKISGGERQRLAIARALLRKPKILIFDEATSSLDSITEGAITKTIREIIEERPELITIQIAHRLSTVIHANTIYVLEKGRIIEKGSHSELLALDGLYSALWKQQTAEQNGP